MQFLPMLKSSLIVTSNLNEKGEKNCLAILFVIGTHYQKKNEIAIRVFTVASVNV